MNFLQIAEAEAVLNAEPVVEHQNILQIEGSSCQDTQQSLLKIKPQDINERTPIDICAVIDISGSMGDEAIIQKDGSTQEYGLSLLDIAKHALLTLVEGLTENDNFSLVIFDNCSETIVPLQLCTELNKMQIKEAIQNLRIRGGTALWEGLREGLNQFKNNDTNNWNKSLFVLTDGVSYHNPLNGYEQTIDEYNQNINPEQQIPIYTFGFGYNIDSKLLFNISKQTGGTFSFIPDSGMIGTIFTKALANQCTKYAKNIELIINNTEIINESLMPFSYKVEDNQTIISLPDLYYGNSLDIVLNYTNTLQIQLRVVNYETQYQDYNIEFPEQNALHIFENYVRISMISLCYPANEIASNITAENLNETTDLISQLSQSINAIPARSDYLNALQEDLLGQITETFSRSDWYFRWGYHYMFSVISTQTHQLCNSFKDHAIQFYGGTTFNELCSEFNTMFNNLPAPKPSRQVTARTNRSIMSGNATMATFNNEKDLCFHPDSYVELESGERVLLKNLVGGEKIKCWNDSYDTIECIVRTNCDDKKSLFSTLDAISENDEELRITQWHPVYVNNKWFFPNDFSEPQIVENVDHVYSFIMTNRNIPIVNGYPVASLGHALKGKNIGHEYFGTELIINDMKQHSDYETGTITFEREEFVRDQNTNVVIGLNL